MANKNGHITGNFFPGEGIITPENPIVVAAGKLRAEKEVKKVQEKALELKKQKQQEINEKKDFLELTPQGNKIIILPYPENPYKEILKGSIIVDGGDLYKSKETGEWDKLQKGIVCGKVIEVGPTCQQAKVGSDILYESRTAVPVPFLGYGYVLTSEGNAHIFITDIRDGK